MAKADMSRAAHWEDQRSGGLRVEERSSKLRQAYGHGRAAYFVRSRERGLWFDKAIVHQKKEHIQTCRNEMSITRFRIEERISRGCPRPWAPKLAWLDQKRFQNEVSAQMAAHSKYDAEDRVRSNLRRFGLLDRRQAALALKRLRRLGGDVPLRVWAATHGCL
jgi:hypothetical protein